jgi:hypothetical protein
MDVEKIKEIVELFGGKLSHVTPFNARRVLRYYQRFEKGMLYWVKREAKALHYEPTADEKKFGYDRISKIFGDFATVDSLADKYKVNPDEILKWEYNKVFVILWKDLELHKLTIKDYERKRNTK